MMKLVLMLTNAGLINMIAVLGAVVQILKGALNVPVFGHTKVRQVVVEKEIAVLLVETCLYRRCLVIGQKNATNNFTSKNFAVTAMTLYKTTISPYFNVLLFS